MVLHTKHKGKQMKAKVVATKNAQVKVEKAVAIAQT